MGEAVADRRAMQTPMLGCEYEMARMQLAYSLCRA